MPALRRDGAFGAACGALAMGPAWVGTALCEVSPRDPTAGYGTSLQEGRAGLLGLAQLWEELPAAGVTGDLDPESSMDKLTCLAFVSEVD